MIQPAQPLVTVLMCCFNAARWLEFSIPSVLNQTFTDFEFIIIDDGSTDESFVLINKFAAIDSRIIALSKSNTGPSDSRNMGIRMSRGKWIAIIDADDIFELNKLEKQIEFASLSPNLVFIGTGVTIIDELGNKLSQSSYPTNHADLVCNLRKARKFPPHASAFYRTDAVLALGGYQLRLSQAEDADLWLRLSDLGQLGSMVYPYVQVRKHAEQISNFENGRRQTIDARMATVSSWLRKFNVPDPITADEAAFKNYSLWIEARISENGLHDFLSFKYVLKSSLVKVFNSPIGICRLMIDCMQKPAYAFRFFWEQLFGESLSYKLAKRWLAESKK